MSYVAKPLGLAIAVVGLVAWYLRWMNAWSDRHANVEFGIKQLGLDIERASWLVETLFEWKKNSAENIPEILMESLSKNLFSGDQPDSTNALHPMDQLASALLGSAAEARLNVMGNELKIGRRELKQAGQDK